MKVGKVSLKNFGSYPSLDFDFSDLGLALVSGDTGSGKSTFMDAVAWILFGATSKEGAADDVKSWDADAPTEGLARVVLSDGVLDIRRIRHSGKNDLFWYEDHISDGQQHRGKDMADTQRLLEKRLGVTPELFLTGSYLTQFSKADSFFIAKAKDRRDVLEKIADQEFAIKIGEKASEARKAAKKEKESLDLDLSRTAGRRDVLTEQCQQLLTSKNNWDKEQTAKIHALELKFDSFDRDTDAEVKKLADRMGTLNDGISEPEEFDTRMDSVRLNIMLLADVKTRAAKLQQTISDITAEIRQCDLRIKSLQSTPVCSACKRPMDRGDCTAQLKELATQKSNLNAALGDYEGQMDDLKSVLDSEAAYRDELADLQRSKDDNARLIQQFDSLKEKATMLQTARNPYVESLKAARAEVNPFIKERQDAIAALEKAGNVCDGLEAQVDAKAALIASLTWLYDKSMELRGLLMARAVEQIQTATNAILEKHFDAALRVKFDLDADKLDVDISNGGFSCPFRSLSGGERTMLKLAFSLSLMRAAQDKAGVSFGMVMLDEPFAGLNSALKVKAFGLLEQLEQEYETVLCIDHDDAMKAQFSKTYLVDKSSGHSEIHEQQHN